MIDTTTTNGATPFETRPTGRWQPIAQTDVSPVPHDRRALGAYHLRFLLDRGGAGSVYVAVGPRGGRIQRCVALKELHPELVGDADELDMFRNEVDLLARIDHPFVVRFLDAGEEGGRHYLVMEYAQGEPLTRLLEAMQWFGPEPQRAEILARIVADLCEGVHAVHEAVDTDGAWLSLVHRDLSPCNLLVLYDGTVRVADLGIATGSARFERCEPGVVRGKIGYSAPEVLHGRPADRTADVWSLGVVLWELLSRQRLFPSSSERVRNAILDLAVPPPSSFSGDVPFELDGVVARALSRDPERRFATAREMGIAIQEALVSLSPVISFGTVARFVNSLIPDGLTWHRELLREALGDADSASSGRRRPAPRGRSTP